MIRMGVLVACLISTVVLASGCSFSLEVGRTDSGSETEQGETTFRRDGIPVSFRYPAAFTLDESPTVGTSAGSPPVDSVALVSDRVNAILIQRYTVQPAVTPANLSAIKPQMDQGIGQLAGTPRGDGSPGTVAGLPSLSYAPFAISEPENLMTRVVVLFDGNQEIFINCQYSPGSTVVPNACDRMLATLERV